VSNGTTNPIAIGTSGSTDVVIEGITIRDGTNTGLRCQGALLLYRTAIIANRRGIEHQPNNMGALHIWDSVIEMNQLEGVTSQDGPIEVLRSIVRSNATGGMRIQKSAASIIGSMIVRNGTASTGLGGISFRQTQGLVMISFSTIAFNLSNTATVAGVDSDGSVSIADSIVTDNNNGIMPPPQVCPACTATYSLFSGTPPIGEGNLPGPAGFVDETADNFHLMASSPARDTASPAANVRVDLDGDARPLGSGFDIGADEVVP
jgi:hypothetical protein